MVAACAVRSSLAKRICPSRAVRSAVMIRSMSSLLEAVNASAQRRRTRSSVKWGTPRMLLDKSQMRNTAKTLGHLQGGFS